MKIILAPPGRDVAGTHDANQPCLDYEGHRTVNLLALTALPTNFPAFIKPRKRANGIAFLAGEPTAGAT